MHSATSKYVALTHLFHQVKEILQEEEDLSEIVQLVGKVFKLLWH